MEFTKIQMEEIVNKVSQSGLLTIDLEDFIATGERVFFDMKNWLFEELILREKDFRDKLKNHSWEQYREKHIAVFCSTDAVVPTWAYMLIASSLEPFASTIIFGDLDKLEEELFRRKISALNPQIYSNQRVVIKGCSKKNVPVAAYVMLTSFLRPIAKSIMFGEPCSTVPLYKKKEINSGKNPDVDSDQ
jgi:hypothetical protein